MAYDGVPGSRWLTCKEHDRRCIIYWVDEIFVPDRSLSTCGTRTLALEA
jgi:hypothetical protein